VISTSCAFLSFTIALARPQASEPAAPAPSLVLVTLDTTRADRLGCYGYPRPTTPTIDSIAAESVLFERCIAVVPHTTPSHCSILTGVYPYEHGITSCSFRASTERQEGLAFAPTPQLKSYAQILEQHGWQTGGFVSAAPVRRITGLAAGFQSWSEPPPGQEFRPGEQTMTDALAWLATAKEPFFLWVHLFDPHLPPRVAGGPYSRELAADEALRAWMAERRFPATFREERGPGRQESGGAEHNRDTVATAPANAVYDAALRLTDDLVKQLRAALEQRGAWPRTTFVIVGDHGEGLGQHSAMTHGRVWNEGVHVPFLVRVPGVAPARIAHVVSGIDVLPTAAALTPGLPTEELLAQARGRNAAAPAFEERAAFSMSPPFLGERALTTGRWKLIERAKGGDVLFDLEKDPHELVDASAANPKVLAALKAQLGLLVKEQKERRRFYRTGAAVQPLSAEEEKRMREELERLGYVGEGDEAEGEDRGE
jgi:arylsulfatase